MRTFDRRLNKLEIDFGVRKDTWRMLVLLDQAARPLALSHDACVRILDEAGHLAPSGLMLVNLLNIPDGLSAEETERYLRENGARVCPGHSKNEIGSVHDRRA